jgi:DnaJ domain
MRMQHTMTSKYDGIKSRTLAHAAKKRSPMSMLPLDTTTFLIMALLVRAVFLLSLTPWIVNVKSFELKPIIGNLSRDILPFQATLSSKRSMPITTILRSSMTDYFSTTETARKSRINDDLLNSASKTTQLLLQTPAGQNRRQREFEDQKNKSVPTREKTLYEILGALPTATKEELKRQYIVMAKLTHPDALISRQQNENNFETFPDFTEVADAYQILSNPLERKKYDRTLHGTQLIQVMVLLGDICIGTTLTVAEITSAIVWVTLMVILQPIAVHVTTELFYLSIDDSTERSFSK